MGVAAAAEVAVVNPDAIVDNVPTVLVLPTTALLSCAIEEGIGWVDVSDGIGLDREPVIPVNLRRRVGVGVIKLHAREESESGYVLEWRRESLVGISPIAIFQ